MTKLNRALIEFKSLPSIVCLLFYCLPYQRLAASHQVSPLNEAHLIIGGFPFPVSTIVEVNSTGYIASIEGVAPEILNWLSQRYNFSYSILQVNETTVEPAGPNKRGFAYYLTNEKCDVILASLTMTVPRLRVMDFTQYFMDGRGVAVLPMPATSENIGATTRPFDWMVWTGLGLSVLIISVALYKLNCKNSLVDNQRYKLNFETREKEVSEYVITVLLSQGGHLLNKTTSFRLAASVWCLSSFILVSCYNSVLVSFVTTPTVKMLCESFDDIAKDPRVKIVVDKGLGADIFFSTTRDIPEHSNTALMGKKIQAYPRSRCLKTKECMELVKSGWHVFYGGTFPALTAMRNDYLETGRCNLLLPAVLQTQFAPLGMGIRKKTGIVEFFDRGITRMHETGLIRHWTAKFSPDARRCLDEGQSVLRKKPDANAVITLGNLSDAFIVLAAGFFLSLFVYVSELVFFNTRKSCIRK